MENFGATLIIIAIALFIIWIAPSVIGWFLVIGTILTILSKIGGKGE